MIGIIAGTSLLGSDLTGRKETVDTPYGKVELVKTKSGYFLQRHAKNTPPHRINHKANIHAFKQKQVEGLFAICSTGSLKEHIKPPCLAVPSDYIQLSGIPTYFDNEIKHITPAIDEGTRQILVRAAKKTKLVVHDGGVYFQTSGPRLETRAEIRLMSNYADIVGMNMASEATLAAEQEIAYACICSVDNYAHGITEEPLAYEKIITNSLKTRAEIEKIVKELMG